MSEKTNFIMACKKADSIVSLKRNKDVQYCGCVKITSGNRKFYNQESIAYT